MVMDEEPEISTYMEQWISDDQPAQIEIRTLPEPIRSKRIFKTTVYDSEEYRCECCGDLFKEEIESCTLSNLSDHAILDRHETTVKQYIAKGYQIIDSYYSPKFEKIKLGLLLRDIDIPDKIV
jgi:hypothetical protein